MRKFLSFSLIAFLLSISLLSKTVRRVVASDCSKTSVGFLPLNNLGAGLYKGKQVGLYPGGSNVRPAAHANAGFPDRVRSSRSDSPIRKCKQPYTDHLLRVLP